MKINYKFADGHWEEIEVTDEVGNLIIQLDKEEHALEERERYHTGVYLDHCKYEGEWFAVYDEGPFDFEIEQEEKTVMDFRKTLSPLERKYFDIKYDDPDISNAEIGRRHGVSKQSVNKVFAKIRKKYETFKDKGCRK